MWTSSPIAGVNFNQVGADARADINPTARIPNSGATAPVSPGELTNSLQRLPTVVGVEIHCRDLFIDMLLDEIHGAPIVFFRQRRA